MLVTAEPDAGTGQDCFHEVLVIAKAGTELIQCEDDRVDLPTQVLGLRRESRGQLTTRHRSDDQHVDIAIGGYRSNCEGPEQERECHVRAHLTDGVPQLIGHTQ